MNKIFQLGHLAWICPLGLAIGASGLLAQSSPEVEARRQLVEAVSETLDARITLSGTVEDETGRPLTGVTARVEIVRFDSTSSTLSREESREEIINGFFRFTCEKCLEIRVSFGRAGHHRQTVFAGYTEGGGPDSSAPSPVVEKVRQRVVLRQLGAIPRLDRFEGRLIVEEGGEEHILPVGAKASGGPAPLRVLPRDSSSGEALPFVRLSVSRSGETVVTRELVGKATLAPEAPRLEFGPAAAVLPYRPAAQDRKEIRYEMREAPADGYGPSLELDPNGAETLYFYCKVGELYGRGSATPAFIEELGGGRKRVVAHVEIELNPDGSRNLETLE